MAELSKAIARLMEERARAQEPATVVDEPPMRAVLHAARALVTPGDRPVVDAFVRQLFEKVDPAILAKGPVAELAALAVDGCRFFTERSAEEPRVRVFEPDLARTGWEARGTVVETVMRDRPFIVDTLLECLRDHGLSVHRLLHPILAVERDGRGQVRGIGGPAGFGRKESFTHVEVDPVPDRAALAAVLTERLGDVVRATDDYAAMRARAETVAEALRTRRLPRPWDADAGEIAAFFDWLLQKHFIFLGYREYEFAGRGAERVTVIRPRSGLGILREEGRSRAAHPQALPADVRQRLSEPPLLVVSKTTAASPIHRHVSMDYVGVKEIDAAGAVCGERRFLGLFTARADAAEPTEVPLLRHKLQAIVAAEDAADDSHDYREIVALFNSMPKAELLALSADDLRATIRAIRAPTDVAPGGVQVLYRPDALGRGIFVVVVVPRDRFSDDLYRHAEAVVGEALGASQLFEARLAIDDSAQVRMHFYFAAPPQRAALVSRAELQQRVSGLLRTWDDRLRDALQGAVPRDAARGLAERYGAALTAAYKAATDVGQAVRDIRCVEALVATRQPQVDLTNDLPAPGGRAGEPRYTALRLYLLDEPVVLSEFLPVLEHLGLTVFAEDLLDVDLDPAGQAHIRTFFVHGPTGGPLELPAAAALLGPALLALRAAQVESDPLNALILLAGLEWRQVDVLRAYVHHAVQIGVGPSRDAVVRALVGSPQVARALWDYFAAKFDPATALQAATRTATRLPELEAAVIAALDRVERVADDRVLRALFAGVVATVRTNFFSLSATPAGGPAPRPALAIKFDCARLPHLPAPVPVREVFVHAPHVSAVHLRGARVARGGIRASDRPDDFRTEILELMKTQMVKNAVIVPAGAKGGFIVKRRPTGAPLAAPVDAYRSFISALLDVTDNIVQGRVTPPAGQVAYDEPDPYLVVAADKGTASFSDAANDLAAQRQFWLGDAFASGGTHGYDHKKEGITARGAWECVRRHFREMGRDVDRDPLTVVGIGDMSGDVFGNGLLLSRQFRLRAAFNHQHIFLDPDPDPARAYAERERLFRLPRSSWTDYDSAHIRSGGGVFARQAKSIPLAAPVRTMLGLDAETASGEEVIRAILGMEADLLWNGGIGTYVKAADETHADAGDSANDAVRVDGAELRVRVVGEGGNLGFTQRGRVEYALRGGRLNTDAIDNSGGVDMSDHEVNLKIALAPAVAAGELSADARDRLLTDLTGEVTRRVLAHNQRQARILSLDQHRSQIQLDDYRELVAQLEADGVLDRRLERLPDREALRLRRATYLGLTRPELAVILAHAKLALQQRMLASALPDEPFFERYLQGYFPDVVVRQYGAAVRSHRLRREIIAVEVSNELIDTMGATFVSRIVRSTETDPTSVVRAWVVAGAVSGAGQIWGDLVGAGPALTPVAEARAWSTLVAALERATMWVAETQSVETPVADLVASLGPSTADLLDAVPEILPPAVRAASAAVAEALASDGVPRPATHRLAKLARLAEVLEAAQIAANLELDPTTAAAMYYRVAEVVDLDWVRGALGEVPTADRWERRAAEGLQEGLVYARRQLTRTLLAVHQTGAEPDECLRAYGADNERQVTRVRRVIDDLRSGPRVTLAGLTVVMRELGRLVGGRP